METTSYKQVLMEAFHSHFSQSTSLNASDSRSQVSGHKQTTKESKTIWDGVHYLEVGNIAPGSQ